MNEYSFIFEMNGRKETSGNLIRRITFQTSEGENSITKKIDLKSMKVII